VERRRQWKEYANQLEGKLAAVTATQNSSIQDALQPKVLNRKPSRSVVPLAPSPLKSEPKMNNVSETQLGRTNEAITLLRHHQEAAASAATGGRVPSTGSSKIKGGSTSGIFADMTVDSPVIGTLVVIIDRAKNLRNRKTIGKQDPYCAARFTVRDSEDYYKLKVSIINDDKRKDLIGETWVDLRKVVVPGGGKSYLWHSLSLKGKYAGEVRIQLTYYDTRPRTEKSKDTNIGFPVNRRPDSKSYTAHDSVGPSNYSRPAWTPDWRARSSSASVMSSGAYSSNAASIPPPEGFHNIYTLPPLDENPYIGPGSINAEDYYGIPDLPHPSRGKRQLPQIPVDSESDREPDPERHPPDDVTVPDLFHTESAISGSKNQNQRVLVEPQGVPNATATVYRDVTSALKDFAAQPRKNVEQIRSAKAENDKEIKLNDLEKFADDFKLHTPIPADLVPTIAKDSMEQLQKWPPDAAEVIDGSSAARMTNAGLYFLGRHYRKRDPAAVGLTTKNNEDTS
jgi:hypothetical protein